MKIRSPHLVSAGAALFAWSMRVVFTTVKIRFDVYDGTNPFSKSTSQPYIYSVWHDSAVMAIFGGKHLRMAALTSWHRDGNFAAKVVQNVGIQPVRGSTGKRGERALREMIRLVERSHITILPDGPRGPRRKISRGMVFLASMTGKAIVPASFVCTNPWRIRGSWTELQIPNRFRRSSCARRSRSTCRPTFRAKSWIAMSRLSNRRWTNLNRQRRRRRRSRKLPRAASRAVSATPCFASSIDGSAARSGHPFGRFGGATSKDWVPGISLDDFLRHDRFFVSWSKILP